MPHRSRRLHAVGAVALLGGYLFGASASTHASPPTATVEIHPAETSRLASASQPPTAAQCEKLFAVSCYQPGQLQKAYDVDPLFAEGVNGTGQTIAVIDAFGSPTIAADLATFDQTFDLPAPPSLKVIQPAGTVPPFDPTNADQVAWAGETTLDVEWAHAMAPGASILVVETPVAETEGPTGFPQIVEAENYVVSHQLAGIISQSFTTTEETFPTPQSLYDLRIAYVNAAQHGVTVLAAAGDKGATGLTTDGTTLYTHPVTTWPPSDPLVTGVGGTAVSLDASGHRTAPDTVWNDSTNTAVNEFVYGNAGPNADATGGGLSTMFSRPDYQDHVSSLVGDHRGVPDISMSASCATGVDTYQSFPGLPAGWYVTCGTSEATPLFAGVVALADQVAGHPLGLLNPTLYALSAARAPGLVDVTQGNNTVSFLQGGTEVTVTGESAQPGYDMASGVGTVDAALLVPELAQGGSAHPGGSPQPGCADNDGDDDDDQSCATSPGAPGSPGGSGVDQGCPGQPGAGDGDNDGDDVATSTVAQADNGACQPTPGDGDGDGDDTGWSQGGNGNGWNQGGDDDDGWNQGGGDGWPWQWSGGEGSNVLTASGSGGGHHHGHRHHHHHDGNQGAVDR